MFRFGIENEIDNDNDSYLILSKNHASDYRGQESLNYMNARAGQESCRRMQKRGKLILKKVSKGYIQGVKQCEIILFMVEQQAT